VLFSALYVARLDPLMPIKPLLMPGCC